MPDIILLGATGFTGRLITRYLSTHPQRGKFTWAIAGRSVPKLEALAKEVGLSTDVAIVQVDVTNASEVERVVKTARVIINTVGPYHRWGTPVVRACVRHAVHYVDLTGETPWIREIIKEFDYAATKSGAIIVPSCGMDSVPSDISAYISNKTLKSALEERENDGTGSSVTTSLTAFDFKGGVSGGTLSTMMVTMEEVDRQDLSEASRPYSLSPVVGKHTPAFQALYRLAVPGEQPIVGGPFVMRGPNSAVVQRTFGLLELEAMLRKTNTQTLDSEVRARRERYGPLFQYDEFMVRWLVKKFMPQPGEGPSDEAMKDGYLIGTNLTTSASNPPLQVKSVVRLKGDPGYLLTAAMISESALSLLLPPRSSNSSADSTSYSAIPTLPLLAQKGGVLTPMTAFGDVLLKRLEDTGLFEFTSTVVTEKQKSV